ncbi:glycoside hydrolase family 76 protein [Aulographum hederae CBS 113979]|uniref:Glycoside hydrolase family 76 protein n=1 Tax=Aulographum hederae CBS 113979 TaxID=1176131 RepID=A0A6G1H2W4_9PEZI|nr:glycoside hydrolase family 76 protein [Aulographum hederae CBS 113979]
MRLSLSVLAVAAVCVLHGIPRATGEDIGTAERVARVTRAAYLMQGWYDPNKGLWLTAGWWNCANILQVLADLQEACPNCHLTDKVWSTTWDKAQTGNGFKDFKNSYYDDNAWWALAWLKAYDLTNNPRYLNSASLLFDDFVTTGTNATCGGVWWNRPREHNTAIANALFISVAAQLANRKDNKKYYVEWAKKNLEWFQNAPLLRPNGLVQDGVSISKGCAVGGGFYTYNQGVILGALIELNRAAPNDTYLPYAQKIADAAISIMVDKNGILHEQGDNTTTNPSLGYDGPSFKGVFIRNLGRLAKEVKSEKYRVSSTTTRRVSGNQVTKAIAPSASTGPVHETISRVLRSTNLEWTLSSPL